MPDHPLTVEAPLTVEVRGPGGITYPAWRRHLDLLLALWGSQGAVARALGVTDAAVSRWVGGAEPGPDNLAAIAEAARALEASRDAGDDAVLVAYQLVQVVMDERNDLHTLRAQARDALARVRRAAEGLRAAADLHARALHLGVLLLCLLPALPACTASHTPPPPCEECPPCADGILRTLTPQQRAALPDTGHADYLLVGPSTVRGHERAWLLTEAGTAEPLRLPDTAAIAPGLYDL